MKTVAKNIRDLKLTMTFLASLLICQVSAIQAIDVEFSSEEYEYAGYPYQEIFVDMDDSHDVCQVSLVGDEFVIQVAQFDQEDFPGLAAGDLQYALDVLGFEGLAELASDVESRDYDFDPEVGLRFTINGNAGHDIITMTNTPAPCILSGGPGNDLIIGTTFDTDSPLNRIFGNDGDDRLYAMSSSSVIHGGSGADTIHGSDHRDELWGDGGNDIIIGFDGADVMGGGTGEDTMEGNGGHDWMDGGYDNDEMYGGAGQDVMFGNRGDDEMHGGSESDNIYGDDDNDLIFGDGGNDWIEGGTGLDEIHGGADDDDLYGGMHNDKLFGGAGVDYLDGGEQNDDLDGGYDGNSDTLVGGPGNDNFYFRWYKLGYAKVLVKNPEDPRLTSSNRPREDYFPYQIITIQLTVEMDHVSDFGNGDEYFSQLAD